MAKIKKKELQKLRGLVNSEFEDLEEYVSICDLDMNKIDSPITTLLSASTQLTKPELETMARAIGKVAQCVFENYSHEDQSIYSSIFTTLLNGARSVNGTERIAYLDTVVEAMNKDAELANWGTSYQLMPHFSTQILEPLTKDGTGGMVMHALGYLETINGDAGQRPTAELITYKEIFPTMGTIDGTTIDRYIADYETEAAERLRDDFGISKIGKIDPTGSRATITSERYGREERHDLNYPSGIPETHVAVLRALRN